MLSEEENIASKRNLNKMLNPELNISEPGSKTKSRSGLMAEKVSVPDADAVRKGLTKDDNVSKKSSGEKDSDIQLATVGGWLEAIAALDEAPELSEKKQELGIEPTFSKSSGVTVDKAYDTSFKLIDDLKSQFGMTTEQAAGVVGNFWHETGGFKFMQELKPTVKGSKGGLAFAQWTGNRRDDFESLLKKLGDLSPESYEGNWAMISKEFDTTEKSALNKILNTDSIVEAAKATSNHYLRPGKPQLNKRISAAEDIYKRYNEDKSLK